MNEIVASHWGRKPTCLNSGSMTNLMFYPIQNARRRREGRMNRVVLARGTKHPSERTYTYDEQASRFDSIGESAL